MKGVLPATDIGGSKHRQASNFLNHGRDLHYYPVVASEIDAGGTTCRYKHSLKPIFLQQVALEITFLTYRQQITLFQSFFLAWILMSNQVNVQCLKKFF